MSAAEVGALHRLARLYRVLTRYRDGFRRTREPSPETLLAILKQLGAPVEKVSDAPAATDEKLRAKWEELVAPVVVAWSGEPARFLVRLPRKLADARLEGEIAYESGGSKRFRVELRDLPARAAVLLGRERRVAKSVPLPAPLPEGYHDLRVKVAGRAARARLIVAPKRCFSPARTRQRLWGAFLPLYALSSERSWGAGDFSDLGDLSAWLSGLGGSVTATLPLLACYLDEPCDPSPYTPVSRLFWNEFFLDPRRAPEWEHSPAARAIASSVEFLSAVEELRAARHVDYRRVMALKRAVLEELADALEEDPERRAGLDVWARARPELEAYARFRGAVEKRRATWQSWPEGMRRGRLRATDFSDKARRYHRYVQWLAEEQLNEVAARAGSPGLYLDLPLGVHPGGFDVWREPDSFALDVSGGAPADRFFTKGQYWGFAPIHPERARLDGHGHFIACLRRHFEHAGMLRIDHFLGLHRLYWIPRGMDADRGTYVQYPAEELYAILCLESHRARTLLIGEDLGTAPRYVRARMTERGVRRMWVAQFSLRASPKRPLSEPRPAAVASLNTHDTPTFAAYWKGLDIDDKVALGLLDEAAARPRRARRARIRDAVAGNFGCGPEPEPETVAAEALRRIAASKAETVLVNLEDLWGETEPQNTPGTSYERPNWMRKAALSLEQMKRNRRVKRTLREVDRLRRE